VFTAVDTGGGPNGNDVTGKHIDVFTGDGKAAEQETFRITGEGNTVCISSASPPTSPPTPNQSPIANAGHPHGPDMVVDEGAIVTLDGSGSYSPVNDPLTYAWRQTAGPTVELNNANTVKATFTAPSNLQTNTALKFQLTVIDSAGLTDIDYSHIVVRHITSSLR
jgi:hypothetical protein